MSALRRSLFPVSCFLFPVAISFALAACGARRSLTLSGTDNDPAALRRALAARTAPAAPSPHATAYLALDGGTLVAWDLDGGRPVWSVDAVLRSRVVGGGGFIAAREADALVARDATSGRQRWSRPLPAGQRLVGLAADEARVYLVVTDGAHSWTLLALDAAAGGELWRSPSPGALGTPAAAGGLVYLPFLSQWLTLLDARTGAELARIRQEDEAVSWVRTTPEGVYYGARAALRLDEGSASGRRQGGGTLSARLPGVAGAQLLAPDAFNPATVAYSALDRTRLLWRATAGATFRDDTVVLATPRALFGVDAATGQVRWARRTGPGDLVAAHDAGGALYVVSADGELAALERRSGALLASANVGGRVAGATFDADEHRPPGATSTDAPPVAATLAELALDRDARFPKVKLFAVEALAAIPGLDAARALLAVVADPTAGAEVARVAGEALVARKDPDAVPLYVEALAAHADAVTGREARAVPVLARALAALEAEGGAAALLAHLEDPATPPATVEEIARALTALKSAATLPALASFLLLHRCDPRFAESPGAAVADTLAALGGAGERELLGFVAADPRTAPLLAEHVRQLLGAR